MQGAVGSARNGGARRHRHAQAGRQGQRPGVKETPPCLARAGGQGAGPGSIEMGLQATGAHEDGGLWGGPGREAKTSAGAQPCPLASSARAGRGFAVRAPEGQKPRLPATPGRSKRSEGANAVLPPRPPPPLWGRRPHRLHLCPSEVAGGHRTPSRWDALQAAQPQASAGWRGVRVSPQHGLAVFVSMRPRALRKHPSFRRDIVTSALRGG